MEKGDVPSSAYSLTCFNYLTVQLITERYTMPDSLTPFLYHGYILLIAHDTFKKQRVPFTICLNDNHVILIHIFNDSLTANCFLFKAEGIHNILRIFQLLQKGWNFFFKGVGICLHHPFPWLILLLIWRHKMHRLRRFIKAFFTAAMSRNTPAAKMIGNNTIALAQISNL